MKKNLLILLLLILLGIVGVYAYNIVKSKDLECSDHIQLEEETDNIEVAALPVNIEEQQREIINPQYSNGYQFMISEVPKEEFESMKSKYYQATDTTYYISDIELVKKEIGSLIETSLLEDSSYIVTKVTDRKGNVLYYDDRSEEFDYFIFETYYPDKDILLLIGGHESDQTFNLTTGARDEAYPSKIPPSPNEVFEFRGFYNGQEGAHYIFKNTEGKSEEIACLYPNFNWYYLLDFIPVFWATDSLIYFKSYYEEEYYKISITPVIN